MDHNSFFPHHEGISLRELADRLGAELVRGPETDVQITGIAPVHRARPGEICYLLSRRHKQDLLTCSASAVLCDKAVMALIPEHIPVLLSSAPQTAFATAGSWLHPEANRPQPVISGLTGVHPAAFVDPTAKLEANVTVEPMAVIGAHAEIGEGTHIGAGVVIGQHVRIGRHCTIAAGASILCAYLGNHVIIHNGARIGQDGFGYAPGPRGLLKVVQVGRVIIQDHVEIGAETTIDRGAMDDTVIGEGTKIDNQVQVGHNVRIGRHCGIVSKVGIAGSTKIGDGVMIGGAAGINGHITIGDGAQIAALSGVVGDVPAGAKYGGQPARPMKDFLRDVAEMLARSESRGKKPEGAQ